MGKGRNAGGRQAFPERPKWESAGLEPTCAPRRPRRPRGGAVAGGPAARGAARSFFAAATKGRPPLSSRCCPSGTERPCVPAEPRGARVTEAQMANKDVDVIRQIAALKKLT